MAHLPVDSVIPYSDQTLRLLFVQYLLPLPHTSVISSKCLLEVFETEVVVKQAILNLGMPSQDLHKEAAPSRCPPLPLERA